MAETDPRKLRPFGQAAERRDYESEDDPLLELARIVGEDSGFHGSRPERPKAVHREAPIDRNALSSDLESELLQELESSFTPRQPASAASPRPLQPHQMPQSRTAPAPEPSSEDDDSDDLLRSIEAQLGEFERRAQSSQSARAVRPERSEPVFPSEDEPDSSRRPEQPRRDRPEAPLSTVEARQDSAPGRDEHEPRSRTPREEPAPAGPPRERAGGIRPTAWRDRPENSLANRTAVRSFRRPVAEPEQPASAPENREPVERQVSIEDRPPMRSPLRRRDTPTMPNVRDSLRELPARGGIGAAGAAGWSEISAEDEAAALAAGSPSWKEPGPRDYRSELRTTFGEFDESSQPVQAYGHGANVDAQPAQELEPSFADPTFNTEWADGNDLDDASGVEPRVSPAGPLNDGLQSGRGSAASGSSRKGLVAAAGVLGVLVLGGAVLALMRPSDEAPSGPPPVIAAPSGDVKIEAPLDQDQAQGETVGEAVYNRVAGNAPAAEEQVVDGAEEPREISRIVLPPPQAESDQDLARTVGGGESSAADETVAASGGSSDVAIGPRRVRTYVVRPDGTIAAADAAPAGSAPVGRQQQLAAVSAPIEPVPVSTTVINAAGETRTGTASAAPAASAPVAPSAASEAEAVTAAPETASEAGAAAPQESTELAAVEPAPQAPEPVPAPAPAPAAPDDAPVDLLSAAPAQEPVPAIPAGEGYLVQVSSQRSMADAQSSLAAMQQRYPSILGDVRSDIQQADLGAKGVYYRVRVGPMASRAEAIELCEALQGAGGSCFVTQ